ncbi:hypothetical protein [Burkholderia cepacia]|uniref:hypothetical protein n=1 Tax=Burkholderia cepacia TaxID=292 RepID=UPI0017875443|nr:hypothetical protein [Burkholderia cepacia]
MKLTLDHNVIIDLAKGDIRTAKLRRHIERDEVDAYVVEIGASEMRERGIRPDRYDLFVDLLNDAGVTKLSRLAPLAIWDVTFWDHCLFADDAMTEKAKEIEDILFGLSAPVDISHARPDSPEFAKWLNRICDIQSMWCHLYHGNDVFVTSDRNFVKHSKLGRLLALGAGRICTPDSL